MKGASGRSCKIELKHVSFIHVNPSAVLDSLHFIHYSSTSCNIVKKNTFRFCSFLYQTLLSAMTEYKAILGRGKIGKQVGPTHLLKSNKLWCHPVGHKSYLKVYLAD